MFNLIRRISYGVIPRPDRPWADDATSNAPQKGKKRRLSSTERDPEPDAEESAKKKVRGDSVASSAPDTNQLVSPQVETAEVKYVTQGVEQVELTDAELVVVPEAIPLPDAEEGELDEVSATPPPPQAAEESADDNATDDNDIASSSNGDAEESAAVTVVAEEPEPSDEGKGVTVIATVVDDGEKITSPIADPEELKKPLEAPKEDANDTPYNDE